MKRNGDTVVVGLMLALILALAAPSRAHGQDSKDPYPTMAPLDRYLMERDAEITLARSAAPPSIAQDAGVMILGKHGYETAVEGKNGFVCMVERSWMSRFEDPEFWNPKIRSAICFNPPAVRSVLPHTLKKTELALAGRSKAQISEAISTAIDKKELPGVEPGVMCYMLSKQSYLNDRDVHWHPHLMLFVPLTDPESWGTNQPWSPLIGVKLEPDRLTLFLLPVGSWSDGTPAPLPQ
jgi:hypothetical protein